jgi:signal transduction histidine kinase
MLQNQLTKLKYINLLILLVVAGFILFFEFKSELNGKITVSITMILFSLMLLLFFLNIFVNYVIKTNGLHQTKINNIFNNITAFLVITNGKKLVDVNRSFLNFFHIQSMEEFLKNYACICDKFLEGEGYLQKKVSQDENWLQHLLNNPKSTHKVKMLDINGKINIFQVNFQEYYQDNETMYIVSFENITALENELSNNRQKDKQLLEQSRLAQMGEMISMIAHQWRQPLAAISSASGAITIKAKRDRLGNELAIELSSKIADYSQHLSATINDFREFFKTNKERKKAGFEDIVQCVLNIVQETIEGQDIQLIKVFETDLKIETFPNEIKQVVLNLLKNAEDVLLENKIENAYIKIYTYESEDYLHLEISDNGGGIPEKIIGNIFDPYFSTKTQKDGTGLGLYMSKTIIQEHCQGKLNVKNAKDGAMFTISLPLTLEEEL